jgi:filamentous hemagglutinin
MQNHHHLQTEKLSRQSGITVSLSNPIVSAAQTVQQMATAASHTKDDRMQALAAGTVSCPRVRYNFAIDFKPVFK